MSSEIDPLADGANIAETSHTLRDILLVLLIGAVIVIPSFFTRDLWNPDEPRYTEVAREMTVLHDYLVPHLNGTIYPDKPPMFFWLAAGLWNAGAGELSGRCVSAVATLLTLLLVYFFMRGRSPRAGLCSALILATAGLYFAITKSGVIDPLLTLFTTIALIAAWRALSEGNRRWWLLTHAACALGVLTKGPVAIAIIWLPVLIFGFLNRKSVHSGGWKIHLGGLALFACILGAWLIPAVIAGGPEYRNQILFNQQAVYTTKASSHVRPFYDYLLQLPAYLLPRLPFVALGLIQAIRDWRRKGDKLAGFISLWFIVIFVFFSCIPAKRERYLMPLMPAAAILAARYLLIASREITWPRLHKWFSLTIFALFVVIGIAAIISPWAAPRLAEKFAGKSPEVRDSILAAGNYLKLAGALGAAMLIVALAGIRISLRGATPKKLLPLLVALMLVLSILTDFVLTPALDPIKSGRGFSNKARPVLLEADKRYMFVSDFSGVYNLYTGIISMPVIQNPEHNRKKALADLAEKMSAPEKVAVIGTDEDLKPFLDSHPSTRIAITDQVGHRQVFVVCNW